MVAMRFDTSKKPIDRTRNKRDVWTVPVKPFKGAHFAKPSHHNSSNRASSQDALKAAQSSTRSSVQAQQDSSHNNTDATGSDANSILCTPRWHPKESKTPNHNQNYSPKLSNSNKES
jgi:hypothetical protein